MDRYIVRYYWEEVKEVTALGICFCIYCFGMLWASIMVALERKKK